MDRSQKEQLVSDVRLDLSGKALIVVARQSGVTVAQSTQLRRDMCEAGAKLRILKNTLLSIAVKDTEFEGIQEFLEGPVVLAYSSDPVSAAKVVSKFAGDYEDNLQIIGGWMGGNVLTAKAVQTLAKLPSLDELRAKLLGLLLAPATKVVRTVVEPMSRVARVVALKS
ncbi:MAG: 50S ribosomal protein L10 [Holosporales bacterium]|jgi:large subunit ribosomal protein L10|nr:50S ribosomal protein L10 [Holosporales bacterium]